MGSCQYKYYRLIDLPANYNEIVSAYGVVGMLKSRALKLTFIVSISAMLYVFGATSVKFNIFPFGYQIGSWAKWAKNQITSNIDLNPQNDAQKISYVENFSSLLFDFDIQWLSADFDDSYGAIVPLSKTSLLYVSQKGNVYKKNVLTGDLEQLIIPKLTLNEEPFSLFTLTNNITSAAAAFGVKDAVLVKGTNFSETLVVSGTYFDKNKNCIILKVFAYDLTKSGSEWRSIYQSKPCIDQFDGMPSWGAGLAIAGDRKVFLTVGDVLHDGVNNRDLISEDNSDYGKIFLIDFVDKTVERYSTGHRNPQGIIKTKSGNVVAVEHGPQGGDELNHIFHGKHYGWPLTTFGVDYGDWVWPLNKDNGFHDGFQQPIMSWTPAIGPSDLTEVTSQNSLWKNDIIISGMRAQSLFRLKLYNGGINFIEKIEIGRRIRKVEFFEGRVFLKDQVTGEIGFFDVK